MSKTKIKLLKTPPRNDDNIVFNSFIDSVKNIRNFYKAKYTYGIFALISIITLTAVFIVPKTSLGDAIDILRIFKGGRYLVVLANNSELRPGGGFIGSFAILNTKNIKPKIEYVETNIYKKDNAFTAENYVKLPTPLAKSLGKNTSWQLHDSNWSSNFPESAATALWFYNIEYNDSLDGVILINATAIQQLLTLTGPISEPHSNIVLEYNNFFEAITNAVEKDYWRNPENEKVNEPKTVLKNFIEPLKSKIVLTPKLTLWSTVKKFLTQKDLVFYNADSKKQAIILKNNWGGAISPKGNFLFVTNATIGTKTSLAVIENATYSINSQNKTAQIDIIRQHTGKKGDYNGGENINYTIVHLPIGSTLSELKIDGKEISENDIDFQEIDDYCSYGFWTILPPQSSTDIKIKFDLPGNIDLNKIDIFKQVGSKNENYIVKIDDQEIFNGPLKNDIFNLYHLAK